MENVRVEGYEPRSPDTASFGWVVLLPAMALVWGAATWRPAPLPGSEWNMPVPTPPPDTSEITPSFRHRGGLVRLELTGWMNERLLPAFEQAGLEPLAGRPAPHRPESEPLNVVIGRVPPGGLDAVAAIPFVKRITEVEPDSHGEP